MGIHDLTKVLYDHAPQSITEIQLKSLFGRKVAIDTPMSLYQFQIAVRPDSIHSLLNAQGENTSHLAGLFYRTVRLVNNGIKPCFVFDGTPPELKSQELEKRRLQKVEAQKQQQEATEKGDVETVVKMSKRSVSVSSDMIEESKKLLRLMGMPVIEAPGEAEATCASLAKTGVVYAAGSEDTDTLTFGAPIILRNLTAEGRKAGLRQIDLKVVLEQLNFTMDQFIDMCILLGCDYCDSIKGIGRVRAFSLVSEYGSIEKILDNIDTSKYPIPENFNYKAVRQLFREPDVVDVKNVELKWSDPDEEALIQFLVTEKNFSEDRIRPSINKLKKARAEKVQERITDFFAVNKPPISTDEPSTSKKRKSEGDTNNNNNNNNNNAKKGKVKSSGAPKTTPKKK